MRAYFKRQIFFNQLKKKGKYKPSNLGDLEIIEKMQLKMQSPISKECKNSQFLLVRHAYSKYNYIFDSFLIDSKKDRMHDLTKYVRFDADNFDCSLHEVGIQQAICTGKLLSSIDVGIVFVSPMTRTLETCHYLFKNHPNLHQIKFIVLPHFAEIFTIAAALQPIENTEKNKQKYSNYDFSILDKLPSKYWQLEVLENKEYQQELLQKVKTKHPEDYKFIVLQKMKQLWPELPLENWSDLCNRVIKAKQIITYILHQEKLNQNKKVVIISHQTTINCLNTGCQHSNKPFPTPHLDNCEIVPFYGSMQY